jgi:imidazole glycerol-phosphate synthase subunit HisH
MIGVIDYGAGNLTSVKCAFGRCGVDVEVFENPALIQNYSHLVLPGVGSFQAATLKLAEKKWKQHILACVERGTPLLGICLGMQLLFDTSTENGINQGLGIINGDVEKLDDATDIKIPHVGWSSIEQKLGHPVLSEVSPTADFYFVHSYHCKPISKKSIIATARHGKTFCSVAAEKSVIGVQFHPEKSQPKGLQILTNFSEWDGKWSSEE